MLSPCALKADGLVRPRAPAPRAHVLHLLTAPARSHAGVCGARVWESRGGDGLLACRRPRAGAASATAVLMVLAAGVGECARPATVRSCARVRGRGHPLLARLDCVPKAVQLYPHLLPPPPPPPPRSRDPPELARVSGHAGAPPDAQAGTGRRTSPALPFGLPFASPARPMVNAVHCVPLTAAAKVRARVGGGGNGAASVWLHVRLPRQKTRACAHSLPAVKLAPRAQCAPGNTSRLDQPPTVPVCAAPPAPPLTRLRFAHVAACCWPPAGVLTPRWGRPRPWWRVWAWCPRRRAAGRRGAPPWALTCAPGSCWLTTPTCRCMCR
jgi:hypothetical protein